MAIGYGNYDYKFKGVMKNSMESIPIGNGDMGANIWVDKNGLLHLLLSKTDAWSENCDLLKTGLVKLKFNPNPFNDETKFRLSVEEACLYITESSGSVKIKIFSDANYSAYNISIESETSIECTAEIINYRGAVRLIDPNDHTSYHMGGGAPFDVKEGADSLFCIDENSIGQYHRNEWSCYDATMKLQDIDDFKMEDPLINRTFGILLNSPDMKITNCNSIKTLTRQNKIQINIFAYSLKCSDVSEWKEEITSLCRKYDYHNAELFKKHVIEWKKFWESSYIFADGCEEAVSSTKGYIYQRYMNRMAGKGKYPIKFNGSIFTMQTSPFVKDKDNYDFRLWGGPYWLQNTRLIYWNMLFAGDFELMKPFFKLYTDIMPVSEFRCRKYFGHDGIIIPETVTLFGTYVNDNYGWNRDKYTNNYIANRYIRWYYSGMLEIAFMMLKYYEFTLDEEFLKDKAVPFTNGVLIFFDQHFERIDGTMIIKPISSLETWQDCVNDSVNIAGIKTICEHLLAYENMDQQNRELYKKLLKELPQIPYEFKNGKKVIAPCEIYIDKKRRNFEAPELNTVFPYNVYGIKKDMLDVAVDTYFERDENGEVFGWRQDGIFAALLGLTDEAERIVSHSFTKLNDECLFPSFFGPNYDFTPDQDHGNAAGIQFNHMLLQSDTDKILLFPTWPKEWNVTFKLPVVGKGSITCVYKNGKVQELIFENVDKSKIEIMI